MINVTIFHNIVWSKYKGSVFTAINNLAQGKEFCIKFVQIAETESDRLGLSGVDTAYHKYPYKLLFGGSYGDISFWRLNLVLIREVVFSKSDLIIIPGYHRFEYWTMLFACVFIFKKRAVFCDSTVYDRKKSFFKSLAKRLFFRLCHGYFGYGQRSREYLIGLGANQDRIFHRCQAAALPLSYSPASAFEFRLSSVTKNSGARFLYAGRLSWEKGLDSLLAAFKLVLNQIPDSKLVLVGSGPLQAHLESRSLKLGIDEHVEFTGSMSIDLLAVEYAKATCFVLPSISEPWGLVINEALSYGCPVVVSNVCGCVPELVVENVTGFQFEVGNVSQLADCMISAKRNFVAHDLVAKRCIDHISSFSPDRAAQQIIDGCSIILKGHLS